MANLTVLAHSCAPARRIIEQTAGDLVPPYRKAVRHPASYPTSTVTSNDARFPIRFVALDAFIAESGKIDRRVSAVRNQLGDRSAGRRRVHHAVTREAGDRIQILQSTGPVS